MRSKSSLSRSSLVAICFVVFAPHSFAQLEWKKRAIAIEAMPESANSVLKFPFKNTTGRTATIKEVQPSCKCVVAKLNKKVFAPGASGDITVTVNHEGRIGVHKESVIVVTDDVKNPYTELLVTVRIADPISISPAFVLWKVGDSPEPKRLRLSFPFPGTEFVEAQCKDGAFQLKKSEEKGEIVIVVEPKSTEKKLRVPIEISARMNGKELRKYQAFAIVK